MGKKSAPISIVTALYISFLCVVALLAMALLSFVPENARGVTDRASDRAVQTRTQSAMVEFARTLNNDWRELNFLAERIALLQPTEIRSRLEGLVGSGHRVSWAGFAGLDGRVLAASGGLLEDADVSSRPWFQAGLRGGFAGDVHDALLLNALLGGDEDNPIRFIDLALPVTDPGGQVIGVIGLHISFGWVEAFLAESAEVRKMDLVLVNSSGAEVFSTDPAMTAANSLRIFRAAASGVAIQSRDIWPDGNEYFASVLPRVAYADLPNFGWRLVGRVPGDAFDADRGDIVVRLWALIVGAGLSILIGATVFSIVYLRPLTRLVDSAARIANDEDIYPQESRTSVEVKSLSESLVLIQSRLHPTRTQRVTARR